MSDYPDPKGKFIKHFKRIDQNGLQSLKIPFQTVRSLELPKKNKVIMGGHADIAGDDGANTINMKEIYFDVGDGGENLNGAKATYWCPCNFKLWGKPNLKIICGACGDTYIRIK